MSARKPQMNGRARSPNGVAAPKKRKQSKARLDLRKRLLDALNAYSESPSAVDKEDFCFHMTDWMSDLENLAALYRDPAAFDRKDSRDVIFRFLIHAVGHLNAASRILLGEVFDPFANKS